MIVILNPILDEVYNYFSLFNGLIKYDFFKRQTMVQWASEFDENLESYSSQLLEDKQYEDAKYLIGMNMLTRTMFLNPMLIHEAKTTEEYYDKLKQTSSEDYRAFILDKLKIEVSDQMIEALDALELNSNEK